MHIEKAGITVNELAAAGAELLIVAADAIGHPRLAASLERRVEALNAIRADISLRHRLSGDVELELTSAAAALVGALHTLADDPYLDSDFDDEVSWFCQQVATFLPGAQVVAA